MFVILPEIGTVVHGLLWTCPQRARTFSTGRRSSEVVAVSGDRARRPHVRRVIHSPPNGLTGSGPGRGRLILGRRRGGGPGLGGGELVVRRVELRCPQLGRLR